MSPVASVHSPSVPPGTKQLNASVWKRSLYDAQRYYSYYLRKEEEDSPTLLAGAKGLGRFPLGEEEAPQASQVIQDSTAGNDMQIELGKIVMDQQKRLLPAVRAFALRDGNFFVDFAARLIQRFGEQCHVFARPFDTVKRRFS